MAAKKPTQPRRYIVISQHDATSDPHPRCFDTYDEALAWAGKKWKAAGLAFDISRPDPFYVAPDTYVEDVSISKVKGKIQRVMHAEGDGCVIWILPEERS